MIVPFLSLVVLRSKLDAAEVYRRAKGAVVTVRTADVSGTGFALGDRRLVVTAYHVVRSSPEGIRVDQTGASSVRLVGFDATADVALLELSRPVSHALSLRPTTPPPGTRVYAIGTPLGYLESTISEGIVSGVRRSGDVALIQITAPVSHGSSGGPVLDEEGRVVGVVDLAIESGQSLNFATSAYTVGRALARITSEPLLDIRYSPSRGTLVRYNPFESILRSKDPSATARRRPLRKADDGEANPFDAQTAALLPHRGRRLRKDGNPFLEAGLGVVEGRKVLLTGPAALYWMYRHDRAAANLTFRERGRTPYYLSRSGIYYRDVNTRVYWASAPSEGLIVPAQEARACRGLKGYNNAQSGETDLVRFAARHEAH